MFIWFKYGISNFEDIYHNNVFFTSLFVAVKMLKIFHCSIFSGRKVNLVGRLEGG